MLVIFESLLRLAMFSATVWIIWALWASRPRGATCLSCDRELERVDVVHCFNCLSFELDGVENLRAVADCPDCGLPFVLSDLHDCEVSGV